MVHGFGPNLAVVGPKLDPSFSLQLGRRQAGADYARLVSCCSCMACSSCQASTRLMAIASTSSRIPSRPPGGPAARNSRRAGATVTGLAEAMARRDVRETIEKIRHGDGRGLHALALERLAALRGQWPHRDRQCRRTTPAHRRSGQKNYLFASSDAGGERAAAGYSLIGTAKLNGLDPEVPLRNVLSRIADHPINRIEELLPWNITTDPAEQSLHAA